MTWCDGARSRTRDFRMNEKLRTAILFAILSTSVVLFILHSAASINQNDFMYGVAPAVWFQHGALYTDVPFVQAPLSVLFYALIVKITGSVNIFLIARVTSILLVLAAVLLPVIINRDKKDNIIWSFYVALCLTNLFINSNSDEIGNYAIGLFCLSVSIEIINLRGSVQWRGFLSCAAIGLATSAKLYFIVMCPAIFLVLLLNDKAARKPNVFLACAAG